MQALVPWVRCALFAEWGRRNPAAAIAYLRDPGTANNREGWSTRQAWFSLFRGWAEVDPDAAAATLATVPFFDPEIDPFANSVEAVMVGRIWQNRAYEAVFHEWARRDGAAAWDHLPSEDEFRFSALRGMF